MQPSLPRPLDPADAAAPPSAAEEREIQERSQRLASVGLLAAGVAHEVNNPAASVVTNLGALHTLLASVVRLPERVRVAGAPELAEELESVLDEARATVGDCLSDVERIVAIVRDLRTFSRLDPARVEPLRMAEVAEEAAQLAAHQVRYRARLVRRLAPVPPVLGDRTRLGQVITNLVLAAAQAIPEGSPAGNEVTVETLLVDGRVVVRVEGTGDSLVSGRQARLFDGVPGAHELDRGAGLDVALGGEIARKHGGELRVDTLRDGRTRAILTLPVEVRARPPAPVGPVVPSRARVLFVDDEAPMLSAYRRAFGRELDLVVAEGGREAIAILAADTAWDAILCDVMMPEVDGFAVYEWIQRERPALEPRLAFVTAGVFTERSVAFAGMLGDRLLEKPLTRAQLLALVERLRA